MSCSVVSSIADETMYSEDDGWEFITLADQVRVCVCVCVHACVYVCAYVCACVRMYMCVRAENAKVTSHV